MKKKETWEEITVFPLLQAAVLGEKKYHYDLNVSQCCRTYRCKTERKSWIYRATNSGIGSK